jgi:[acyl-carrier-protein] S-malonyltransferase
MADALKELWPAYRENLAKAEAVVARSLADSAAKDLSGEPDTGVARLGELIDEGPSEVLSLTHYAQPALMLVEHGWDRVLRDRGIAPACVAGHSLGEYAAMLSAGVFDFDTALDLVMTRGRLMSEAAAEVDGGMAAVLGLDREDLDWDAVMAKMGDLARVEIANLNCPGQIVISGVNADVERAGEALRELGAKRVVPLTVSGAFHSTLMRTAAQRFAAVLQTVELSDPEVPVVQNSTSEAASTSEALLEGLGGQMAGPVLWQDGVVEMVNRGVDRFVEVGPGTVLKGLSKRIVPDVNVYSIDDEADRAGLIGEAAA